MSLRHVVVTGGAGFIGSHLCDALLERGYAVTAIDNFVTGRMQNLARALGSPRFELLERDVSRGIPERRLRLLGEHGLHGVLHFACPASPLDFERIPFEILEVDSLGTMRTADLALRHGARYVLASTSEVYGDPLVHPQPETYFGNVNPIGPRACYDEAKRFAEAYVSTLARGKGRYRGGPCRALDGRIVRIFNTYGPRMRLDDGRIIPEFCRQALLGGSIPVHGDGRQTRSFCYVSDLVDGILRVLALGDRGERAPVGPINLGNPDERSVHEMALLIQALAALEGCPPSRIEFAPARRDDPGKRRPDIGRARELLGWEPKVQLEEGLAETLDAFRAELGIEPRLPAGPVDSEALERAFKEATR